MALFAGISGWAYPEWRGPFYPSAMPAGRMLAFYAQQFNTVEVNATFYRLPTAQTVASWCEQVPPDFRFAFKAHRAITHRKQFAATSDLFDRFADLLQGVGTRLGPVLFQFETIADVPQLADFLGIATQRFGRVVAEFRHKTWFTEQTFGVLAAAGVALCQTETDEGQDPAIETTFAYRRLRRSTYTTGLLSERLEELRALGARQDVFAFLKHDVDNAVLLRQLSGAA